jgi:hypothetical protein
MLPTLKIQSHGHQSADTFLEKETHSRAVLTGTELHRQESLIGSRHAQSFDTV